VYSYSTIVVGLVRIYYTLPYFKALAVEEVSRVIPLLQLTPVFVLILSSLLLRETLKPEEYVAFGSWFLVGHFSPFDLAKEFVSPALFIL